MIKYRVDADFWRQDDMNLDSDTLEQIRKDEMFLTNVCRMDEGVAAFFARQLEFVKAKQYDVKYPAYRYADLIPIETDAGPGATTITVRSYDIVGTMKMLGSYSTDLPRADVFGVETHTPVQSFGEAFGYSLIELRQAIFAGIPLDQRKANAVRKVYEATLDYFAWFADGSKAFGGLYGMFFNPYITKIAAPNGGWCDESATGLGKTPQQIIQDINTLVNKPFLVSKGVHKANRVILPLPYLTYIKNTMVSDLASKTIYEFVQSNNPGVQFDALNQAFGVSPSPATPNEAGSSCNVAMAYEYSSDNLAFQLTQPLEQLPVQTKGLDFEVPCHARHGGVIFYYPLSCCLMYNL